MPRPVTSVRSAVVAVALAAVLIACGGSDTPAADGTVAQVSGPLSFTGELLGGGQLEGSSLAGQAVLLWFWAPT